MTDPYLLLTPVLALAVLALARFVACDRVFQLDRLDEVPPPPQEFPFVESFVPGTPHPNDFNGWVGMAIRVGGKPLTVTHVGRIMLAPSTEEHQVKLVLAAGSGGADLGMVGTIPIGTTSDPDSPLGFAYAELPAPVVLNTNTEYYVVSHEFAAGDGFLNFADTTVMTTNVAQVTSAVFNFDNTPNYVREGNPSNTHGPVDFKYEEPT